MQKGVFQSKTDLNIGNNQVLEKWPLLRMWFLFGIIDYY